MVSVNFSAYSCSLPLGLLSVVFVYVFFIFLLLKNYKMESSILFHGGTKILTSPTAKYRINDVTQ